jgi:hypothetical protein
MWAVKFVAHLEYISWKTKKLRRFDNTSANWPMPVRQFLRNLQTCRAFIAAFNSEKRWMKIKKSLFRHWPQILNFFIAYFPILVRVKPKAHTTHWAIKCLMANYCIRWRGISKGLSEAWGRATYGMSLILARPTSHSTLNSNFNLWF